MPSEQFNNLAQMFQAQRRGPRPDITQLREGFEMLGQMMPSVDGVEISEVDIAGMSSSRIVPDGAPADRALLYLHGGGYCIGSRNSHNALVATLARSANTITFLPEYRLAPEAVYPAAVDDALAAYDWLLAQGFAASKVAVAGESAGGGLAAALLIALRDAGKPLPSSATLISPWCDLVALGEVSQAALDIDFLRPETVEIFAENYAPDEATRSAATCSPGLADLSGLPPMFFAIGGQEILCDQGSRMAAQAKNAGVDVTLEIAPEMFHAWPLFAGALPEADEAIAQMGEFITSRFS